MINVTSNTSILVQWDPPMHPNGILTYYDVIVFNKLTNFNFSAQIATRELALTGLGKFGFSITIHPSRCHTLQHSEPFTAYTVQVLASTEAGRGSATSTLIFTEQGGRNMISENVNNVFSYPCSASYFHTDFHRQS